MKNRLIVVKIMTNFSEKLKKLRRDKGWSQDEFGEKIGIHGRHVGKYETSKALPNADTLLKIADVFEVSIDYLLRDEDDFYLASTKKFPDQRLLTQLALINSLPQEDKNVIASLIDAFVKRQQIQQVIQQ